MKKILILAVISLCVFELSFAQVSKPVIYVDSPLNESLARKFVHVKVRTDEKDSCVIALFFGTPEVAPKVQEYETFLSVYDKMVDMSAFQGKEGELYIDVSRKGESTWTYNESYLYVDSSKYLEEYMQVPGIIRDFKDNRILYVDDSVNRHVTIYDIGSNAKDTFTPEFVRYYSLKYDPVLLTPTGATTPFYDWNNGQLYSLGGTVTKVTGDYGVFKTSIGLYRREFSTKTNIQLTKYPTYGLQADITQNGNIAYNATNDMNSSEEDIFFYNNGRNIQVTKDGGYPTFMRNIGPLTDGSRILAIKRKSQINDSLFLYENGDSILLSQIKSLRPYNLDALTEYQINKNYVAYVKDSLPINLRPNIWLRDKDGNEKQIFFKLPYSFSYYPNEIDLLNENGDVFIRYNYLYQYYKRYFYNNKTGEEAKEICSALGKLYYQNNTWYLAMGRTLFKVNVGGDVLPLQLTSFSAKRNGKTNLLQWSTTQELNTDRFEIQRSNNSRDFVSIGLVKAFNNGKSENGYTYTDQLPLKATNYYRLKMIDKDGKFTYSAIKSVNNNGSFDVSVYPNPVKNILTLNFNTEKVTDIQIEIVNVDGKKLQTKKVQLPYGSSIQTMNVAALSKGTYFVQCITKDGNTGIKFVKE